MQSIATQLENLIDRHVSTLRSIPEDKLTNKPMLSKWSKKEILGHLIDSAQNNIRRFVCGQYEEDPKIVYNQDKWVEVSNYQAYHSTDLIQLWQLLNKQIVVILKNMPPGMEERRCLTQDFHTLEWLALDYIKHLEHHLHQVMELNPVAYT